MGIRAGAAYQALEPQPVVLVSHLTGKPASGLTYSLTAAGTPGILGGAYIWAVTASDWDGATVALQALGPDGATWLDVHAMTANGIAGVEVGEGATLRLSASGGAPVGLASSLT